MHIFRKKKFIFSRVLVSRFWTIAVFDIPYPCRSKTLVSVSQIVELKIM